MDQVGRAYDNVVIIAADRVDRGPSDFAGHLSPRRRLN